LVFVGLVGRLDARTIRNDELNYTLVVPDRLRQLVPKPGMVDLFGTSDPEQGMPDALVSIAGMHGIIGRESLDPSKVRIPGVPGARVRKQNWKEFQIDVIEAEVKTGGATAVIRGAQVPLRHEAIQLTVAVPQGKEREADALLAELLAGLDGPSNWLTDDKRWELVGNVSVGLAVLAVAIGIALRARRMRRRRARSAS
jgi:hypothetical protein